MSYYVMSEHEDCRCRLEGAKLSYSAASRLFKKVAKSLGCTQGDDVTALHPDRPRSVQLLSHGG